MNRKIHNTLLALSTTGLMLVAGLMVATPLAPPAPSVAANASLADIMVVLSSDLLNKRTAALEARTRHFESEMRRITDPDAAVARTASFVADIATDAALSAALSGIESATAAEPAPGQIDRKSQRTRRTSHSAFATPYFSFAHGLRAGNGA